MASLDRLKPHALLIEKEIYRFDYPEVFVLLLTVTLITIQFDFNPTSMALFVSVCLPSLMILIYNYRRPTSFWTSNIVVVLLSAVIGAVQFCGVLSLSLLLLMGVRIIVNEPENRIKLIMVSVVTSVMLYYVSVILYGMGVDCSDGWLPFTVLLASIIALLWQFWDIYHKYIYLDLK